MKSLAFSDFICYIKIVKTKAVNTSL